MQPNVIQLLAQLRDEKAQNRGMTTSEIAELIKLKGSRTNYQKRADESLDRARGFAGDIQETSGELQSVFSDVPAYKRPQREGVSKGSMNFGLLLGGLGALAGVDNPQNLTGTAIGGQKALKDQEYNDELDTLRERMDADREARMGKVEGLRAKIGGLEAGQRSALTDVDVSGRKASDIGSELFQRTQAAQGQANADREYNENTRRFGLSYALDVSADRRADLSLALQRNPYLALDEQAETLAPAFGGDVARARKAVLSHLIVAEAQAEWMPKMLQQEFGMNETKASQLAEQLAQLKIQTKFLPEQIRSELASGAASRANAYSSIEDRNRRWEAAMASGDSEAMLQIDEENIGDLGTVVTSAKKTLDTLKERRTNLERQFKTGALDTEGNPLIKDKATFDKQAKALDSLITSAQKEWETARSERDKYIKRER